MSKELERLERLAMPDELHKKECERLGIGLTEDYNILKAYFEVIDNANPSEALESLEKIKDNFGCDMAYYGLNVDYEIVEQALLKAQEQEKVLKIIFEKEVDIYVLRVASSVEHYNNVQDLKHLTQEEFDLLKRYYNE